MYCNLVLYNQNILKKEIELFDFTKSNILIQTKKTFAKIPALWFKRDLNKVTIFTGTEGFVVTKFLLGSSVNGSGSEEGLKMEV